MQILDVIIGVFMALKRTKIVGGLGFAPNPAGGAYSALPDFLDGFKVAYF